MSFLHLIFLTDIKIRILIRKFENELMTFLTLNVEYIKDVCNVGFCLYLSYLTLNILPFLNDCFLPNLFYSYSFADMIFFDKISLNL